MLELEQKCKWDQNDSSITCEGGFVNVMSQIIVSCWTIHAHQQFKNHLQLLVIQYYCFHQVQLTENN